tara:strand:+ start:18894 stop:20252 length:1359 start_codon:yes stop_codon:yes gene_type:complete
MGLLDALGSLTIAAGEELPGITQRVNERAQREVNATIGADFEAARIDGDVEGMKSVFERARGNEYNIGSTAPSAETFSIMQTAITGFENDEEEKEKKRIEELITLGGPAAIEAQVERYETLNPGASPEEVQAYRDNVTMRDDVANRMAKTKVEKAEIEVETMKGKQEAQNQFNDAYESGNTEEAARLAERMGDTELAKMIRGEGEFNKEVFDSEEKFRTKFEKQTENFTKIQSAYSTLLLINENPSPASDLATIFAFMKMLDPTSVVREGEFANAQNSGSAEQKLWNNYNQLLKGYRLGEVIRDEDGNVTSIGEVRQNFMDTARAIYMSAREGRDRTATNMRRLAASYKQLDPNRVVYDTETDRVFAELPQDKLSEAGRKRAKEIQVRGHNIPTWSKLMTSTEGIGVPFGQEAQYQPPKDSNGQGGADGNDTGDESQGGGGLTWNSETGRYE